MSQKVQRMDWHSFHNPSNISVFNITDLPSHYSPVSVISNLQILYLQLTTRILPILLHLTCSLPSEHSDLLQYAAHRHRLQLEQEGAFNITEYMLSGMAIKQYNLPCLVWRQPMYIKCLVIRAGDCSFYIQKRFAYLPVCLQPYVQ